MRNDLIQLTNYQNSPIHFLSINKSMNRPTASALTSRSAFIVSRCLHDTSLPPKQKNTVVLYEHTHAALKQTSAIITSQINDESDCLLMCRTVAFLRFRVDFIIHCLRLGCCSHPLALASHTRFQQCGPTRGERGGKQCRSPSICSG